MKIVNGRHENDCMAVCLASLFEISIDKMPEFFYNYKSPEQWYENIRKWLFDRGWHLYYAQCVSRQFAEFQANKKHELGSTWPPRGYWLAQIARVEWIIEKMPYHVVIMKDYKCVFNPDSSLEATKENDVFLLGYYLLTPLDPMNC